MIYLLTITIQSTHYFLVDCGASKLLVDAGWAGSLGRLKSKLNALGVAPSEIRFLLATHYHPDHGGLVQEVKRDFRARLILHECQLPGLVELKVFYAKKGSQGYLPVTVEKGDLLLKSSPDNNRAALMTLGIPGVIVETPGHSDDSVCLVLDDGQAFVGDLHPPDYSPPEAYKVTCDSWKRLVRCGAKVFYPSHSDPFTVDVINKQIKTCA